MKKFLVVFILTLVATIIASRFIPHPFSNQVNALLDETGASYQLKDCSGGWVARELHCDITISSHELSKVLDKLEFNKELWHEEDPLEMKHLVIVPDSQNPCSSKLRNEYLKYLHRQHWTPSRHSFDSAILFYNKKTGEGCLFLGIAYG